jgi:hypothetical protein
MSFSSCRSDLLLRVSPSKSLHPWFRLPVLLFYRQWLLFSCFFVVVGSPMMKVCFEA